MPRLSKSLPKHRGSGQAVVTLCGVDHYLGPYGTKTSKLEYDRIIAEWLVNGRQSQPALGATWRLRCWLAGIFATKCFCGETAIGESVAFPIKSTGC